MYQYILFDLDGTLTDSKEGITKSAQFAQQFAHEGVHFINREDDAGDPGLRTSKLSYHPVALLEKYTVTVDEEHLPAGVTCMRMG